jgi:sugar phosphate isomerase/epimerase
MQLRTRRGFIKLTGSTLAVAGVSSMLSRVARADAMGLPPGIQLYSVRDDFAKGVPEALHELRKIGFLEVETAGFGKYTAKEFRTLLDDAGLKAPSAHLKLTPQIYAPLFEDANSIGAHYATSSSLYTAINPPNTAGLAPGQRPVMAPLGLDGFKKLAEAMNDLGSKAKRAGLEYAYHNHNYEFEKMPDGSYGYDILINNTDHQTVKFEIDCGWMCAAGADPAAYMTKYPGRFRMIHVKDFQPMSTPSISLSGSSRPKGSDLGQGFIDYKGIFAAGRVAGIQHAFSEQEDPFPISQMASARVAYDFLHASS